MQIQSKGWEDPLEKETTTRSNILAWKIPRTEELGGLQSLGWTVELVTEVQGKPFGFQVS